MSPATSSTPGRSTHDSRLYGVGVGSDALYREAMDLPEDERATLAVRLLATVDEPAVDDSVESYTAWLRDIERDLRPAVAHHHRRPGYWAGMLPH